MQIHVLLFLFLYILSYLISETKALMNNHIKPGLWWARLQCWDQEEMLFSLTLRKQTKHTYLQWKSKIHCTCTQAKHLFPSPQHTCVHAQTHTVLVCGCAQRLSAAEDSFTSQRDGAEGQFCHIVRFLEKPHLCRLPSEMCWISAFLHQLAFTLQ